MPRKQALHLLDSPQACPIREERNSRSSTKRSPGSCRKKAFYHPYPTPIPKTSSFFPVPRETARRFSSTCVPRISQSSPSHSQPFVLNISRHSAETLSPYDKSSTSTNSHKPAPASTSPGNGVIRNRVRAGGRSNASPPALYAQSHPQPRTSPMASVSRGTTLGITRRGDRRKKWKMQARSDPRENYPDCGKRTNSQRATGERRATSAKSPCLQRLRSGRQVYPGRYRRREKKQWKRLWISCRYRFDKRRQKPESRSRRGKTNLSLLRPRR